MLPLYIKESIWKEANQGRVLPSVCFLLLYSGFWKCQAMTKYIILKYNITPPIRRLFLLFLERR